MNQGLKMILVASTMLILAGCNQSSQVGTSKSAVPAKTVQSVGLAKGTGGNATWISDPTPYQVLKTKAPNYTISVPILEYHDADYVPDDIATLKPGQLEQEFAWLKYNQFHPINLGQLYAAFYYGYKLPSRPIVLTFDDGYESMYTKVLPLLEKYNYQATFFIVSGFTHTNPADNNKTFPTLTLSELKAFTKSSLVDVEDHTGHHYDLSKLSVSAQQQEIDDGVTFLQGVTGHSIKYFCYPDGGYTSATVQILQHRGFLLATTQHQGYANLSQGSLTLDRLTVLDSTTLQQFASLLASSLATPDPIAGARFYQAGAAAFGKHDYQIAIDDETKAIVEDPGNYKAYTIKGIALCYAGHYNSGMSLIDEALKMQPNYGYGLFNKALGLELYGYYDQAIATYQTAIPLGSGKWWKAWAYYGIASIYGRRGDVQHVVEYLKEAEALSTITKIAARTEKDFNPVRSSPVFQALLR
ncbi:polysaccharide deacetylase family protein [Alicyclobacillus ferrooxydans]|uniref:polysaccharide deacetylase family protein n=1 Tax=Alicyclobacillus ferrooxydans TaxID=471514 RepID=UPI0006D591D9|nr:polysaccharide deacetylase family protein [Alicyclobacillus ferrooxydans]